MDADTTEPDEDVRQWPIALSEDGRFQVSGSPMHLLMTAERLHRANADRLLREFDIDHRTWRLLVQLGEHQKRSIQDIATATGFDRSTMSKLVDRAERLDLVGRTVDERDRRRNTVSLSAKGWSALRKCSPKIAGLVNGYFGNFEPEEYEELIRLVKKMRKNVALQHAGLEPVVELY